MRWGSRVPNRRRRARPRGMPVVLDLPRWFEGGRPDRSIGYGKGPVQWLALDQRRWSRSRLSQMARHERSAFTSDRLFEDGGAGWAIARPDATSDRESATHATDVFM